MKIVFNFDGLQEADDGSTTHYGGVVVVNGIEIQAHGTDRDENYTYDVYGVINRILGRELAFDEQQLVLDTISVAVNCEIDV